MGYDIDNTPAEGKDPSDRKMKPRDLPRLEPASVSDQSETNTATQDSGSSSWITAQTAIQSPLSIYGEETMQNPSVNPTLARSRGKADAFSTFSAPRRRVAVTTTKSTNARHSVHDIGLRQNDEFAFLRHASPPRSSTFYDQDLSRSHKIERELHREHIENAGKGFAKLIDEDAGKESIADLFANVKDEELDEEAEMLAQDTQKLMDQKLRSSGVEVARNPETRNDDGLSYPSERTLSHSRSCKQYIEAKYHAVEQITNDNEVYNPLQVIRKKQIEKSRNSNENILNEKYLGIGSGGNRQSLNRTKQNNQPSRRHINSIWEVTPADLLNYYEHRKSNRDSTFINTDNLPSRSESVPEIFVETERTRGSQSRLSQIFNPPDIEPYLPLSKTMPVQNDNETALHDRGLSRSLNEGSKKKRWSLNPFKRKDKDRKRVSKIEADAARSAQIEPQESSPGTGFEDVNAVRKSSLTAPVGKESLKSLPSSESSLVSGRSSFEDTRRQSVDIASMLDKTGSMPSTSSDVRLSDGYTGSEATGKDSVNTTISEREHAEAVAEDYMENISEQHESSSDLSALSSRRNSLDVMKKKINKGNLGNAETTSESSNNYVNEDDKKSYMHPDSEGELDDSDEPELIRPTLTGETVLVNLDKLPPDLESTVTEFQESGLIARNAGGRFVELDVGLKGCFRFHKLIWHNDIPIRLDVMLVDDRMQEEKKIQTIDDLLPPNEKVDKAKNMLKLYEEERKIQETNSVTVKAEHTLIDETNIITNLIFSDNDDTDRLFLSSMLSHDNNSSYWKVEVENRVQELDTRLKKIERKLDDMKLRDQRLLSEAEKMSAQIDEILAASHVDRDNQDHLYTLKVLEDEIQLLNSKSILWDIFYIMLSYVLAGVMVIVWFAVHCFKSIRSIFLLPRTIFRTTVYRLTRC